MYFVGHTRFSVYEPKSPSWRLSRWAKEGRERSYLRTLYSEHRMNSRFDLFLNHTLPTLNRSVQEHSVLHVVTYSKEMPEHFRDRLEKEARQYDWLRLEVHIPGQRIDKTVERHAKEFIPAGTIFGQYRLDDDDILGANYFEQASSYIREPFVGMLVSFARGIQVFYENGVFHGPRVEWRPKIALGLLKVCKVTQEGRLIEPKRIAHPKSDLVSPVVLDSRQLSYIHTMHIAQDTGADKPSDDLGKRYRNYMALPKPEPDDWETMVSNFPFTQMQQSDYVFPTKKMAISSHLNLRSLLGLSTAGLRVLKRKIWLLRWNW